MYAARAYYCWKFTIVLPKESVPGEQLTSILQSSPIKEGARHGTIRVSKDSDGFLRYYIAYYCVGDQTVRTKKTGQTKGRGVEACYKVQR